METSAPKRRKTSPRTAIPIDNNTGGGSDAVSSGGQNGESTTPTDPLPDAAAARRSGRRSFASPTHASLARHNPDILGRRRQQRPVANNRKENVDPATTQPQFAPVDMSASIEAQLEQDSGRARRLRDAEGRASSPANSGGPEYSAPSSPTRAAGGGLSAPPKRSPFKLPPRPLPPPGPADEEPVLPTRRGRNHFFSRVAAPPAGPPEPELPPTPEHPDPVVSTPPSGIHNTPSKRPRARALAARLGSSPSKLRPTAPDSETQQPPPPTNSPPVTDRGPALRRSSRNSPSEAPLPPPVGPQPKLRQQSAVNRALRGLKPSGYQSEKEKEKRRDALLAEVAQLQADLKILRETNERKPGARSGTASKKAPLDVLRRHVLPDEKDPVEDTASRWLEMALNPISFLPFAKPTELPPNLFAVDPSAGEQDEAPPISHHPVPMTAEEALPFLQVFTPLAFTDQIAILPRDSEEGPILQRHIISASSASPTGLFTAQIEMTVDVETHNIRALSVPRLDPASAPELRPFIDSITTDVDAATNSEKKQRGRSLRNNVSVLAWAMGEWVRVATQRAHFWRALERELASKEGMIKSVARARTKKRRAAAGLPRRREADEPAMGEGDAASAGGGGGGSDTDEDRDSLLGQSKTLSRAELLPYMGRTAMELGVPVASGDLEDGNDEAFGLRVQWRIQFDWTGEAQNQVELLTGVPGKWRMADARGNLSDIPGLFSKLVQGDESPLVAVRSIVALLCGDVS